MITHKNVCRIYEFARIKEGPCISMEYVEGETIRSLLNRIRVFNLRSACEIAAQICSGLREAHAQGVAHRDLKPENLMMDRAGNIKIMDFGVARIFADGATTTVGGFIGTPAYMAPEQVEGRTVDQRADIYAFGLILYEMLTGNPTFTGDTAMSLAYKQVHEAAPSMRAIDPGIPESVEALVGRCLEKEPERRFQNVDEIDSAFTASGYRPTTAPNNIPVVRPPGGNTTFIIARRKARSLMLAIQAGYFCIYAAALYYLTATSIGSAMQDFGIPTNAGYSAIALLAMLGIATRLYLSSALTLQHPDLPEKFRRMFPALWLLDSIWATSPLLMIRNVNVPLGVIFGSVALLLYLPFSQKTLMENLVSDNPQPDR
jgi:serine/threonine protein kinase